MAGSEREAIRDDHFYTSLLLGCRRAAAVSGRSLAATTKTTPSLVAEAPRAAFQAAGGSPDANNASSAVPRPNHNGRDGRKTSKSPGPKRDKEASAEEVGGARDSVQQAPRYTASTKEAAVSTPNSAQWSSWALVAGSAPASADNSPKREGDDASEEPQRKTKRRFRKATHTIRKEEKEHLLTEISQLEAHIAGLKKRAISAASSPEDNERDKRMATRVLRDAVQNQQREFAKIQAMMSEYTLCNIRAGSPLQTSIRLQQDELERRSTLMTLKLKKLQDAKQFLTRRRPSMNPCKPMCEDHRYELPNGDFCSTRFTTIQFEGVHSVRQVFDLLAEYFCNIEICISEKLGHITIREDDDTGGVGIVQNCLVSVTNSGLPMESNTVLFSEFYGPDDSFGHAQGHGLIVAEFVDEDERHPYHPRERIRRDVSAILELTSYSRTVEAFGKHFPVNPSSQPQEVVVVMTRWVYSKMRYPSFPIARAAWEDLRDNVDRWGETMHRTLVESLRTSSGALQ